jgi:hypothetical protein
VSNTRPYPFVARLFALQISARPEDAEELDFLEDWSKWKAEGGVKTYDARRSAERISQYESTTNCWWHLRNDKYETKN